MIKKLVEAPKDLGTKIAEKIYDSAEMQELFDQAYEEFPDFNSDEADDATQWIIDQLDQESYIKKYGEKIWSRIEEQLYEMILAGLT